MAPILTSAPFLAFFLHLATSMRQEESDTDKLFVNSEFFMEYKVEEGTLFQSRYILNHSLWVEHLPFPSSLETRFSNRKEAGAGGFGEAWKAWDTLRNAQVIIKLLFHHDPQTHAKQYIKWSTHGGMLGKELEEASQECKIAIQLHKIAGQDKQGASRLMDCLEDHVSKELVQPTDVLYLVLEDCAGNGGMELQDWIAKNINKVDYLSRVVKLFKEVLEGLAYLSERRWCHHDIKPQNIMVKILDDGTETVKIIDFGGMTEVTAKKEYVITNGMIPSTPEYGPPELFAEMGMNFNSQYPHSYDIYSAGCVLYEMLTGEMMFGKWIPPHREQTFVDACRPSIPPQWANNPFASPEFQNCQREERLKFVKRLAEPLYSREFTTAQVPMEVVTHYLQGTNGVPVLLKQVQMVPTTVKRELYQDADLPKLLYKDKVYSPHPFPQNFWQRHFDMFAFEAAKRPQPRELRNMLR